jgi:hypothetical protein
VRFLFRGGTAARGSLLTATGAGASAAERPTPISRKTLPHRSPARIPLSPSGESLPRAQRGGQGEGYGAAPGARASPRPQDLRFPRSARRALDSPFDPLWHTKPAGMRIAERAFTVFSDGEDPRMTRKPEILFVDPGVPEELSGRGPAARPPLTAAGVRGYAGLLAGVYRIVSGDVPYDPAENVGYVVVNSRDKRVVATFSLPGHPNIPKFSITVTVPSTTETYEAGRLDEHGRFIPANFTISETSPFVVAQ